MAGATLISRHKMDDSDFQRKARKAGDTAKNMADKMKGQFIGVAKSFAGIFAVGAGVGFIKSMFSEMDRIGKLATRLDMSAESLQRISFIAEQGGTNLEVMAKGLTQAARVLSDPSNTVAAEAVEALGLNVQKFLGSDAVGQVAMLSDAFKNAEGNGAALQSLSDLLGMSFKEMLPTLRAGGEAVTELGESIDVMADDSVRKIEELNDKWNKFTTNFKVGAMEATMATASMYASLTEFLPAMRDAIEAASGLTVARGESGIASLKDKARRDAERAVKDEIAARNAPNAAADAFGAKMEDRGKKIDAAKLGFSIMLQTAGVMTGMANTGKELALQEEEKARAMKEQEEIAERRLDMEEKLKRIREFKPEEKEQIAALAAANSGLSGLGEANLAMMRGSKNGAVSGLDYLAGFGMSDKMSFPGLSRLGDLGKKDDPNQFRKAETELIQIERDNYKLLKEALLN